MYSRSVQPKLALRHCLLSNLRLPGEHNQASSNHFFVRKNRRRFCVARRAHAWHRLASYRSMKLEVARAPNSYMGYVKRMVLIYEHAGGSCIADERGKYFG